MIETIWLAIFYPCLTGRSTFKAPGLCRTRCMTTRNADGAVRKTKLIEKGCKLYQNDNSYTMSHFLLGIFLHITFQLFHLSSFSAKQYY